MGAEIVAHGNKLWVYAGAQPITSENDQEMTFSDFFSFDMVSGLWKAEKGFSAMNDNKGAIMGKALTLYNSPAAIFVGGCDATKQECGFDSVKSILFEQPNAVFELAQQDNHKEFEGREGHSLV
jgi:hypothetical protein